MHLQEGEILMSYWQYTETAMWFM